MLNDYAGWWPTLRPGQREKVRTWLWPDWRYRCRAMPQRTGRQPSGWALLPLVNRLMRWPDTVKAILSHRVPPRMMGIIPNNTGGFGDVEKDCRVFVRNKLIPLQKRLQELNKWLCEEGNCF